MSRDRDHRGILLKAATLCCLEPPRKLSPALPQISAKARAMASAVLSRFHRRPAHTRTERITAVKTEWASPVHAISHVADRQDDGTLFAVPARNRLPP